MIGEIGRYPAPGIEVLGLAFDGPLLWISSRESHQLSLVDPFTWTIRKQFETPGAPFGIAIGERECRIIIGFGDDDDDRYIYSFDREGRFSDERIACPDLSGIALAFDAQTLYLAQAHNRRIVALDDAGAVTREIRLERIPVGITILNGEFSLITANRAFKEPELNRADGRAQTVTLTTLGSLDFAARALAFDGTYYWTSDRRAGEVVAFTVTPSETVETELLAGR